MHSIAVYFMTITACAVYHDIPGKLPGNSRETAWTHRFECVKPELSYCGSHKPELSYCGSHYVDYSPATTRIPYPANLRTFSFPALGWGDLHKNYYCG